MTADAVGGVWSYAVDLAAGFWRHGIHTTLAVMGPSPSEAQLREAAPFADVVARPFALEWQNDPWEDVERAGDWLLRLEADVGADIVHLNGFSHAACAFRAPVAMVAHSCVLSWWRACRSEAAGTEWDRYRAAVEAGIAAADAIVAPTGAMLDAFLGSYSGGEAARGRSLVIRNAVDPSAFQAAEEKGELVLGAGRIWDEAKNLHVLAKAAGRLPWPVVLAGDTGGREISSEACFLGPVPRTALASLMRVAPIFAAPAKYEPFGLAVMEAALSECALVLGDIPSLRESWQGVAEFVDPNDVDPLVFAIGRAIERPDQRRRMGSMARERALELSRPDRMVAEYMALYAQLIRAREEKVARCA